MLNYLSYIILINRWVNYRLFMLSSHIGPSIWVDKWFTEIVGLLAYSASSLSEKLSSGCELCLLFFCEISAELIISTWVAIVHISDFSSTLCTLFFSSIHSDKDSKIEISLQTNQWLNVFTVTTGGWTYCW